MATFVLWKVEDTWRSRGWTEGDNESRFCQCFLLRDFTSFSQRKRTLGHHGGRTPRPSWVERTACAEARVAQARRVNVWLTPRHSSRIGYMSWCNLSARGSLSAGISGVLWRTKRSVPDTLFGNSVPEIRFGEIAYNEVQIERLSGPTWMILEVFVSIQLLTSAHDSRIE